MAGDPAERVTELEIQLAHLQRQYDQLNEVVTEQASLSDRMSRQIRELQEQVKELKTKPLAEGDPLDEKPPHY